MSGLVLPNFLQDNILPRYLHHHDRCGGWHPDLSSLAACIGEPNHLMLGNIEDRQEWTIIKARSFFIELLKQAHAKRSVWQQCESLNLTRQLFKEVAELMEYEFTEFLHTSTESSSAKADYMSLFLYNPPGFERTLTSIGSSMRKYIRLLIDAIKSNSKIIDNNIKATINMARSIAGLIHSIDVTLGFSGRGRNTIEIGSLISGKASSSRYLALRCLGSGGFAEVWEVLSLTDTPQRLAAKITYLWPETSPMETQNILEITCSEVRLHGENSIKSINGVLNMLECFEIVPHIFCSIMELSDYPDLNSFNIWAHWNKQHPKSNSINISKPHSLDMNTKDILIVARDVVRVLANLESVGVIHRDIKPANILIHSFEPLRLTLADFGIHKRTVNSKKGSIPSVLVDYGDAKELQLGTVAYMSPECLCARDKKQLFDLDSREDSWQLGMTLLELYTGKAPVSIPYVDGAIDMMKLCTSKCDTQSRRCLGLGKVQQLQDLSLSLNLFLFFHSFRYMHD